MCVCFASRELYNLLILIIKNIEHEKIIVTLKRVYYEFIIVK